MVADFDVLSLEEKNFKAYLTYLVLNKETEKAIQLLCEKHKIRAPRLAIGITKGKKKALGVYSVEGNAISFRDQDQFFNPFVVFHEMYHCLRSRSGEHRGNEKNADRFALSFIQSFNELARSSGKKEVNSSMVATKNVD